MTFLNPLFLLAGGALLVPLVLHLFHRRQGRRMVFPALRYLLRTEREHARRIRLRQLLLLLIRMLAVLLLVLSGARLALAGRGAQHPPTALAIVLDNSLSAARVVGDERVLDILKARAREVLAMAGPEDRVWILAAAEPWLVFPPMGPNEALERLESVEPTDGAGDLPRVLERARGVVSAAEPAAREIHLLSDLQASAFDPAPGGGTRSGVYGEGALADVPIVAYRPPPADSANHFLRGVVVGGGLPPLAGQRTEVAVELAIDGPPDGPAPSLPVRVVTGDRVQSTGTAGPGDVLVLPAGPFPRGAVEGWVETDPDALAADDRRYFAFAVRPPVPVERRGGEALFIDEALAVLESAGRIEVGTAADAPVLVTVAGEGLSTARNRSAVVVPPSDATRLPSLNRRLAEANIPWRYGPPAGVGESVVTDVRAPVDLEGLAVRQRYGLSPADDAPPVGEILARTGDGSAFIVSGREAERSWLLLAAPADPEWTDLPVSAGMVPLLEWGVSRWVEGGGSDVSLLAGEPIATPAGATHVEDPAGTRHPVDPSRIFRRTASAGLYRLLAGDSVISTVAANPPPRESDLRPVSDGDLRELLGGDVSVAHAPAEWRRSVFRSRRGHEPWRWLLLGALGLLVLESGLAAAGRPGGRREPHRDGEHAEVHG